MEELIFSNGCPKKENEDLSYLFKDKNDKHDKSDELDKSIKDILIEGGRYYDVIMILSSIVTIKQSSVPVDYYISIDGIVKNSIDTKELKEEAAQFMYQLVQDDLCYITDDDDRFDLLLNYVHSKVNMKLHNYGISISHGNEPREDMEYIKPWLVLENLLCDLQYSTPDFDDESIWYIPDGWKGNKKENEEKR